MNKPVYLLPFIFVYKMVLFIFKLVIFIPRYSAIGFFFVNIAFVTLVVNLVYKFCTYFLNGFIYLSFFMYKTLTLPFRIIPKKKVIVSTDEVVENKISSFEDNLFTSPIPTTLPGEVIDELNHEVSDEVVLEELNQEVFDDSFVLEPVSAEVIDFEVEPVKIEEKVKAPVIKVKKEKKKIDFSKILIKSISVILAPFRYYTNGVFVVSYVVYKFIKYVILGFLFPLIFIYDLFFSFVARIKAQMQLKADSEMNKKKLKERISREEQRNREMIEKRRKAAEKLAAVERKKEEELRKKEQALAKRKELRDKNEYINDSVVIEKKTFGDKINDFIEKIVNRRSGLGEYLKKKYNNLAIVRNQINRKEIVREALLINFEGEDAVKSEIKLFYEYIAKDKDGKIVKGIFEAFSKVEVHSYLLSEGLEVYSIKPSKYAKFLYGNKSVNNIKFKTKDLIFFLTQLSTYIKAGIPLVEALKILSRQFRQKHYQRIFKTMIYDLTMGENFSIALEKQGAAFPKLLINMVRAAEMTGELPEALDNMADYFTETEKTRKQMVTAMIYPSVVLIMSVAVITFIIMFVVPKFVEIYKNMSADQIPPLTVFIINLSDFLEKNIIWLFLGFAVFVLIIHYLYKNVRIIRTLMQYMMMRFPVMGNIIIYNEVTIFTKTFSSLLSHNVFITDSMEVLNRITNNEIYKMIIVDTISNLAKGDKISKSFNNHWAFPVPAYEMLVTGEKTGQLPEMMAKVADYYQDLHKNAVTRFKTLIEPALIVFLTFVVGGIILAVIVPMFSMYQMIK